MEAAAALLVLAAASSSRCRFLPRLRGTDAAAVVVCFFFVLFTVGECQARGQPNLTAFAAATGEAKPRVERVR